MIIDKENIVESTCPTLSEDICKIRQQRPLIHNITNYVVMNISANTLLALGASPVMAHAAEEVEEMVGAAAALVLNIGTLDEQWVKSMFIAGRAANKKGIPIVFDPVGAGATSYRTTVAKQLIAECRPSVIRGNASEILAIGRSNNDSCTKGVDSTADSLLAIAAGKQLAVEYGSVVVISGETDYIIDTEKIVKICGGDQIMTSVTGMGCTATAVVAAFCAVDENTFAASANAMKLMSMAGEKARSESAAPGSFVAHFVDAVFYSK